MIRALATLALAVALALLTPATARALAAPPSSGSFPPTDQSQAQVAVRTLIYIQPRQDVFQFEVALQVVNLGAVAWLPTGVSLRLPRDWKAFRPTNSASGLRFEADEASGVRLKGTIPPGQHNARFTFQVPNRQHETARFILSLPPRVTELQVLAEAAKGMSLTVSGLPQASPTTSRHGQRLLVTRKVFGGSESPPSELSVTLSGIPTGGVGRYIALGLALLLASAGVILARSSSVQARRKQSESTRQLRQAQQLILDELVLLYRAKHKGTVGPEAYATTRSALVNAVARLELARRSGRQLHRHTKRSS